MRLIYLTLTCTSIAVIPYELKGKMLIMMLIVMFPCIPALCMQEDCFGELYDVTALYYA